MKASRTHRQGCKFCPKPTPLRTQEEPHRMTDHATPQTGAQRSNLEIAEDLDNVSIRHT
jgi:hypothetical protein